MPSACNRGPDFRELASEKPDIAPLLRLPTNRYRTPRTVCKRFATDPHPYSAATAWFGRFRELAASSSARQHSTAAFAAFAASVLAARLLAFAVRVRKKVAPLATSPFARTATFGGIGPTSVYQARN